MRSKYKHPPGKFAKRKIGGKTRYYGNTRRLTLSQIRAYHYKRRH